MNSSRAGHGWPLTRDPAPFDQYELIPCKPWIRDAIEPTVVTKTLASVGAPLRRDGVMERDLNEALQSHESRLRAAPTGSVIADEIAHVVE